MLRGVFEQLVYSRAITFSISYDGLSFQHLATVLISVFALCCGPGLLFRGPLCINQFFCGLSLPKLEERNFRNFFDVVLTVYCR